MEITENKICFEKIQMKNLRNAFYKFLISSEGCHSYSCDRGAFRVAFNFINILLEEPPKQTLRNIIYMWKIQGFRILRFSRLEEIF